MIGNWAAPLRQLHNFLVRNDEEFECLRAIDINAPDLSVPLDTLINSTLAEAARLSRSTAFHVYIFDGSRLCLTHTSGPNKPPDNLELQSVEPPSQGVRDMRGAGLVRMVHARGRDSALLALFPGTIALAILPLFIGEHYFGTAILESSEGQEISLLFNDASTKRFLDSLALQLSNVIVLRRQTENMVHQGRLTTDFFKEALDPIKCLNALARDVARFLPRFGPLTILPDPQVQILLFEPETRTLRIAGTTGDELPVTRVSVDASFCGALIKDPTLPYRMGDPQQDPDYKDYLGSYAQREMRHELAVRIVYANETLGILNLESEHVGAFKLVHANAMLSLCSDGNPSIAPMVYALRASIGLTTAHQLAMTSALDKHLAHVSSTLRHGTATLNSTISGNLYRLAKELGSANPTLLEYIAPVQEDFDKLTKYIETYRDDIRGFSEYKPRPLRQLLEKARGLFKVSELRRDNIVIELEGAADIAVFTSLLLAIHVHDLLHNSIHSIKFKQTINPGFAGRITISAQREPEPKGRKEKKLNRRCRVTISDNGMGCSEDVLARVGEPDFTTKHESGGSGFGIFGTQRYLESIDGIWLQPRSVDGQSFEVAFLVNIDSSAVHTDRDNDLKQGGETNDKRASDAN